MTLPELIPLVQPAAEAVKASNGISPVVQGALIALGGGAFTSILTGYIAFYLKQQEFKRQKEESLIKRKHDSAKEYITALGKITADIKEVHYQLADFYKIKQEVVIVSHLSENSVILSEFEDSKLRLINQLKPYLESDIHTDIDKSLKGLIYDASVNLDSIIFLVDSDQVTESVITTLQGSLTNLRAKYSDLISYTKLLLRLLESSNDDNKIKRQLDLIRKDYIEFDDEYYSLTSSLDIARMDILISTKKQIS